MENKKIEEKRIEQITDVIQKIASGDFSKRASITGEGDSLDAIASGINMLAEEIEANTKEKEDQSEALLNMLEDVNEAMEVSEKSKEALKLSSSQWETTFNAINDSVCLMDINGKILRCNRAMTDLLGKTHNEISGQTCWEVIHGTSAPVDGCSMVRMLKSHRRESNEFLFGERMIQVSVDPLFDEKGNPNGAVHIITDITNRKKAEKALIKSEKKYRTLIDNLSDTVVETDADGNFTFVSPQVTDTFGFKPEELVGKNSFDFIHPDDQGKVFEAMEQILQDSKILSFEYRIQHKDGHFINVSSSGKLVEEGDNFKLVSVISDITERKKVEEELMDAMNKLKRTNLELEQFNKVAYHDLQEPLRTVSSYVQFLEHRYKGKLDDDVDVFLGYIIEGTKRMHRLINDLLSYSSVGTSGKSFKPTDSSKIIENVISSLQPTIEEKDAMITYDPLPLVEADNSQLFQLSKNLLSNAIKFHGDEPPRVHVSAEQMGNEWMFSVHDNGIGIDPEFADRIFTIFQRLHSTSEYSGTGIGLAICKKIVENHGGRIWVESEPGKGSTFYFTIPKKRGERL